MKGTKVYNARAQLLFCSLNLLFSDVPVAVAVVVILNSLTLYLIQIMQRSNYLSAGRVTYHLKEIERSKYYFWGGGRGGGSYCNFHC